MQGTPAHLEYIGPLGRKRKKNCAYNEEKLCACKKSQSYMMSCVGRLYCYYYDDTEATRQRFMDEKIELERIINNNVKRKNKNAKLNKNSKVNNIKNVKADAIKKDINPLLNKKVILKNAKTGSSIQIKIVSEECANPFQKLYSTKSGFAMALKGKKDGDTIKLLVGKISTEYIVLYIG